ncbi:U3 snoRNP protein, partial [Linnemannia gamsii]
DDTPIRLWEIDPTGEGPYMTHSSYMMHGSPSPISSMTYSPDGRSLVSGSIDGTIRRYDTASGDPIQAPSSGPFQARLVVISPDGRVASARETGSVTIWDAGTGLVDFVLCGHTETVEAVSFSPCGHWIATGSKDKSIRLWDSRTGQLCRTLTGHTSWVSSLGFSPDGLALVSGSKDGTLRIWGTNAGESRVLVSVEHWAFLSAAYAPDGLQIASHHLLFDPLKFPSEGLTGGLFIWDQQTGEQRHILDNSFVWRLLSEAGEWKVRLVWNAGPSALTAFDATIVGTVGLSTTNRKLLLQRGATDVYMPDISALEEVERDAPGESETQSLGEGSIPE